MPFCWDCGAQLESVKAEAWSECYKCPACKKGYQIAYQDRMSGAFSDVINRYDRVPTVWIEVEKR